MFQDLYLLQSEAYAKLQELVPKLQETLAVPPGLRSSDKVISLSFDIMNLATDIHVKEKTMKAMIEQGHPHAGVICPIHGKVDMNSEQYDKQIANPNALWSCPLCGKASLFDDERFEQLNPEPEDHPGQPVDYDYGNSSRFQPPK